MDVTKQMKKGRGRGSSRGSSRGGGGRGRGRGRGRGSANKSICIIDVDDEDDLCNMALEQAELENNSIAKSFEVLNAANELEGFDPMAGSIWIYPTNRPVRDYQYEIVKTALFNNTLVSLPTGLGKTFISAVVMYNFQRWYPTGIIVFMAPTRPLVTQQLDACHNTVGISPAKTIELTGQIVPKKRQQLWQTKNVFFLTPQVMLSDLERNFFPAEKVRCIVVDEAHKATGNHAYVQVIAKISEKNRLFRVLALSATPGSDIMAVKQVFKNLLISRVELRSENSLDILPYIHEKKVEKIVVKLDDYLRYVHDQLLDVFQMFSGKLMKVNALSGRDGTSYSKFQLLKAREMFRKDLANKLPNYQKGYIEVDYAICISLAHAIEILLSHGLRTFYIFLHGVLNKEKGSPAVTAELRKNLSIQNLLDEVQKKLNISVENSTFDFDLSNTSGIFTTVGSPRHNIANRSFVHEDADFTLSHPKLKVLKDIVHNHFLECQMSNATTRVMIFSQYRDSVQEIGNMLNSLRPMVKPMVFIGQANTSAVGRGLKQKDQVQVVQQFREGGFNVLVSTSVGEEGLDIGEVDLIICFDASKSPTRLIQRMGRTGRQRDGRTVFLLTQGKEERCYQASFSSHSSISKSITDPNKLQPFLYKQSPRMVPTGMEPTCYKMSIVLSTELSTEPMQIDLEVEDTDNEATKVPQKITKKKQTNVSKKKKNEPAGTSSKKTTAKDSSNNIVKLFKRMHKTTSESASPNPSTPSVSTANPPIEDHQIGFDDDGFGMDDGLHMFADDSFKPFHNFTVLPKIFDTDRQERLEWKPCTTFFKNKVPSTKAVYSSSMTAKLDHLILDEKELAAVDHNVKSRKSFSYLKEEFCECGNVIEPRGLENERTSNTIPIDPIVLDEPFIDEDFFNDLPPEFLDELENCTTAISERNSARTSPLISERSPAHTSHLISERSPVHTSPLIHERNPVHTSPPISEKVPICTSPLILEKISLCTPPRRKVDESISPRTSMQDSSDDDTRSEFSPSPEICENRYLQQLKQIKEARAAAASVLPVPSDIQASEEMSDGIDEFNTTEVENVSKKKFKFKKKPTFERLPHQHDEKQDFHEMSTSPSPPLSPILNLPTVTNDLFDADKSPILSLGADRTVTDKWKSVDAKSSLPGTSKTATERKPVKFAKLSVKNLHPVDECVDDVEKNDRSVFKKLPSSKPTIGFCTVIESSEQHHVTKSESESPIISHCKSRQSLKLVKPSSWKCAPNDVVSETRRERLPIVRTSPDLYKPVSSSDSNNMPVEKTEPPTRTAEQSSKIHTAAERQRFKFKKSSNVPSVESHAAGCSSKAPTVKNLLSRNRPRKHNTAVAPPSTPPNRTCTSKTKIISAPLTSPDLRDSVLSDDSPEVVFTKQKTPTSHSSHSATGVGKISGNPDQACVTTAASCRISNQSRLRFSEDTMSRSRSVIKSPRTPTPLRYSFSSRSMQSRSPVSSKTSTVSSRSGSFSPFTMERRNITKQKRGRKISNPFIEIEAEVVDDDSDTTFGDENDFEFDGLDDLDDSFVANDEEDTGVTDSQQVMYLESVKDAIPAKFGRIEKPLSPKSYGNEMNTTGETYEDDSFCQVDDEVEYMDVGVFTQAMNQAVVDLAESNSGRQTRRAKREAMALKNAISHQPKQRRRIVTIDDSSDEDE